MEQQGYEEDLLRRWFQQDAEGPAKHLTETDICDIAEVLTRSSKDAWSRVPRIYSVLRKIGQLDAIDAFIDDGFTDVSFPFSGATLPETLRDHSARLNFLELQHLVYDTEALDLERHARHGHFSDPKDVPLKKVGELGKGGFGYVDRVVSTISHKEYARKLISRGRTFRKDKQVLRAFTKELSNLKGLSHRHLVKLAGSYTDKKFVAIIMLPVADMNLQTFLENTNLDDTSRSFLRPFFGCLTSALSYLHDNRIRHKDIKPSNVLIKHDQVYLTDFGTSLDWSGCDNSTTVTAPPTTPRYCAPEVMAFVERNTSSDIWSLGCVFLEMWTVLKRYTLDGLKAHMSDNGTHVKEYHHNLEAIAIWIQILENAAGPSCDLVPSRWIQNMLQHKPRSRWNCHILANQIHEASIDPSSEYAFKGLCCLEPDDGTTDETESSDGYSEAGSITPSLSSIERRDSGQVVESAESPETQIENLVGDETAKPAELLSRVQLDAPIPRISVNDCSAPLGAFVEDESDSLARELYDPSTPRKATEDSEEADAEHDDLMYTATNSNFSGSDDETPQKEQTNKIPSPLSSTSSLSNSIASSGQPPSGSSSPRSSSTVSWCWDEHLREPPNKCSLCIQLLDFAIDAIRLPCQHWIHKSCYAKDYTFLYYKCPTCISANRKPASQANRYFCEFNDWAQKRNEAQDRLRSYEDKEAAAEEGWVQYSDLTGRISPAHLEQLRSSPTYSTRSTMYPSDSDAISRRRKKRAVRLDSDSDPHLMSQAHGVPTRTISNKREPRSVGTDTKAVSKSDSSMSKVAAERFWKIGRKKAGTKDEASTSKRGAPRQRTERKFTNIESDSSDSDDPKRRYEAAYWARTKEHDRLMAEERRSHEDIRYAGATQRPKPVRHGEARKRPVSPISEDIYPARPKSAEPPATKVSAETRPRYYPTLNKKLYLPAECEPGSEHQHESYSSDDDDDDDDDDERGREPAESFSYTGNGPEDIIWAPRSAGDVVNPRRSKPEDVRWAPKSGEGYRVNPPRPRYGRTATYVY